MSEYNPNRWVLLQIGDMRKVLGAWSGGYLDSDNWRLSSVVETIEDDGEYWLFKNHSGSVYKCHKKGEGMTALSSSIYRQIEEKCKDEEVELSIVDMEKEEVSPETDEK